MSDDETRQKSPTESAELPLAPAQYDAVVDAALGGNHLALPRLVSASTPTGVGVDAIRAALGGVLRRYPLLAAEIAWKDGDPVQIPGAADHPLVVLECDDAGSTVSLRYSPVVLDDLAATLLLDDIRALGAGRPVPTRPGVREYLGELAGDPGRTERARAFWAEHLAELTEPTTLFEESTESGRTHGVDGPDVTDVSAASVHAAWSSVVARHRGEALVAVGVLVDTRTAATAVGPFERIVPVVSHLDGRSADRWLRDGADAAERAAGHALLTTAEMNTLSPAVRGARPFDSVVDLRRWDVPDRTLTAVDPPVLVGLRGGRLHARVDPARVDADQVARLLDQTAAVLSHAGDGGRPVAAVPLVGADGFAALEVHNRTRAAYPAVTLHGLVERQADRTPERVALVHDGRTMTYRELDVHANRLAHHLLDAGVRTDDVVGLCADPGFELVVGIIAVLKAGAAYAPLDPTFPGERLAYLAGDLDCDVVLVQSHLVGLLPPVRRTVLLDRPEEWRNRPVTRPQTGVGPDNLAYVMYTSGSTGRPKGVLVQHGGSVNFVWWMASRYPLPEDAAALQWTAYSFDAAVWELFWPLFVGARAVLAPRNLHLDLAAFTSLVRDHDVATLHFVPAMLQTFLTSPDVARCASLTNVFVSGEPVPTGLVERFHELLDADLTNLYGVTEVSIDSTHYLCPRTPVRFIRSGVPLSNTRTHVLDADMRPLPFGARGEVYIGGDSVTRGYLGRPALTAERFVPDPFGDGGRLYRTGDVAALLPDGNLRFFGRSDHQIKVRGIRIDLLEVADEIMAHPGVRDCLVVPWGDGDERSLAAYLLREDGPVDENGFRAFLAGKVPSYMVPTAVLQCDTWPVTSNGKIDRQALPDPSTGIAATVAESIAPRTPTERVVAGIWADVLGIGSVGVGDDFFSVGGNSLLATRVMAQVRSRFGVQLPLRAWLEASCVADLSATIDRALDDLRGAEELLAAAESLAAADRGIAG